MGILLVGSGKGRKFKIKGGKKKPYFGNAGYLYYNLPPYCLVLSLFNSQNFNCYITF